MYTSSTFSDKFYIYFYDINIYILNAGILLGCNELLFINNNNISSAIEIYFRTGKHQSSLELQTDGKTSLGTLYREFKRLPNFLVFRGSFSQSCNLSKSEVIRRTFLTCYFFLFNFEFKHFDYEILSVIDFSLLYQFI